MSNLITFDYILERSASEGTFDWQSYNYHMSEEDYQLTQADNAWGEQDDSTTF